MDKVDRLAGPLPTAGPDTAQDEGTGPHSPTPLLARGLSRVSTGCFSCYHFNCIKADGSVVDKDSPDAIRPPAESVPGTLPRHPGCHQTAAHPPAWGTCQLQVDMGFGSGHAQRKN